MRRLPYLVVFAVCAALAAQAGELGTDAQRAAGKVLYDKYCAQCHGASGDGKGHATPRVKPEPRDFTAGKYKFRTTPSGALPTDEDVKKVIRQGLPYTSMPAWPQFSETDITNVVYYLKTFSPDFQDSSKELPPIEIPKPPPMTEESVARGREVYDSQGCAACHGNLGRSDGLSAPTLTNDWGYPIRSVDMTKRWTFRGGPTRSDIFRTFSTGVNGTPMPSYADSLEVEQRWDLVDYIYSLGDGDTPDYTDLLIVAHVEDDLDLARADELFQNATRARFPLVGQIIQPGRNFFPSTESLTVEAIHNRQEIAFRVRWNDMRADTGGSNGPHLEAALWDEELSATPSDEGEDEGGFWGEEEEGGDDFWGEEVEEEQGGDDFWGEDEGGEDSAGAAGEGYSDAVAIQFPKTLPTGAKKPYFIFGDAESPVELWFVDLARGALQMYNGNGAGAVESTEGDEIEVVTGYEEGQWTVLYKRRMRSSTSITFEEAQFVPLAFSVWDGFNNDRGNRRSLSAWFHLYLEPSQRVSAVGPMIRIALLVLFVEIIIIFFVRRKHAARQSDSGGRSAVLTGQGAAT